MTGSPETLEFQAEARQLLQLMIHSIYSNKDIFLRELISNASDALDKLRLATMVDKDLDADTSDLHIDLVVDSEHRTLTIRDNGVGMSRDEVVALIGTIARSGTAELLAQLRESNDAATSQELIGQFGIGFYSSFMVADRVTLVTRRAGQSEGTLWESTGDGTYTISSVDTDGPGTAVTLHLKPEDSEDHLHDYTAAWRIREIVKRYSDFIAWPIRLTTLPASTAVSDAAGTADADTSATDGASGTQDAEAKPLNSMKALWARPRSEVEDPEYHEFYRHISHDWTDPLEIVHMRGEGHFEYEALLFIPAHAGFGLLGHERKSGIQLYVKRVFIMDDCDALMPGYLRFVKGVVDAHDLSLNVSREILQQDRQIQIVRRRLVKKILTTIRDLQANEPEKYRTFWAEFGRVLKEGLLEDPDNRETLLDVLSLASTHDPEQLTTLREYVERMKDGQAAVYYLTGESRPTIENSPHLEALRAKGYEALILTDPVDEMWVEQVTEYQGKPLQSIAKGRVDLDSDEREGTDAQREQQQRDFADLLSWLGTQLTDEVKEVRLSSRLTTSPACIVGDDQDVTPTLEKLYRAMGQELPQIKRILELNPDHALVRGLRDAHAQGNREGELAETAELLLATAVLAEGGDLKDPARFARLVTERLAQAL